MTTTRGQHCSAPPRDRLNQISHIVSWYCSLFLLQHFAEVEVVAGAHVHPADPIGVQWDSNPAISKAMEAHWCCYAQGSPLLHALCVAKCCPVGITPSVGQLRTLGEVGEFRLCTLQPLNYPGHALGLFCGPLR